MIGEFFSKVAIVVTAIMLAQTGFVGGVGAAVLGTIGVVASFLRDANLRQRGVVRRLPTLGWVWVLSLLVAGFLMAAVRSLAGQKVLAGQEVVLLAGLVSFGVRAICIGVDGLIDWVFSIFWPLIDRVLASLSGANMPRNDQTAVHSPQEYRTVLSEPQYGGFVPPPNWRYQCPQCAARVEHKIDVCWNCGYGAEA